ncbi:hypothetical protein FC71_GL001291 [Latilactobacillus sakei subsp. carnosus DSM 15831]|uniref:hypothetical protein n=1 Tax=Latilactobacillus sakei TaxID=1599 RepID=UPI00019CED53|nr:hypothetical protein [Latilactobacillus sakei]KRL69848.1 hypothetical protein FC71_GL001291 [Latilactobacillus sakei subsp. carnosus DSM 15831]GEP20610.1 hypothetical protein LSA03nite_01980 [Latilactobacillus sakei subsp. carnosus]
MAAGKTAQAVEDRSKQSLKIYNKAGKLIVTGELGKGTAAITGLAAGTKVAAGDYKASFSDGTNESDKVDVPVFNVLPAEG